MSLAVRDPAQAPAAPEPGANGLALPTTWHALPSELATLPPNTAPLMTNPWVNANGIRIFANLPFDSLYEYSSPVYPGDTVSRCSPL